MPRRVTTGSATSPRSDAVSAVAPKPVGKKKPARERGFEPGGHAPKLKLDTGAAKPAAVPQRNVFEVVAQRPDSVTAALAKLDALDGVEVKTLGEIDGLPVQLARLKGAPPPPGVEPKRVLLTGGVHGSEPAGTISAVELIEAIATNPKAFAGYEFTVVPLVNPEGFRDGTRHNDNDHTDLNREVVRDGSVPKEMQLLMPVLDEGPWALALDLHASGSTTASGKNGFFAIRTAGSDALLHATLGEFAKTYPVLDETTQRYTLVEPGVMESKNTGTVKGYLYEAGTKAAFTLEAPALRDLDVQVNGLVDLVQGFLKNLART